MSKQTIMKKLSFFVSLLFLISFASCTDQMMEDVVPEVEETINCIDREVTWEPDSTIFIREATVYKNDQTDTIRFASFFVNYLSNGGRHMVLAVKPANNSVNNFSITTQWTIAADYDGILWDFSVPIPWKVVDLCTGDVQVFSFIPAADYWDGSYLNPFGQGYDFNPSMPGTGMENDTVVVHLNEIMQ